MADGLFYLKCNNFNKILSSQYEVLRDEKTLTDITFVCDGRRVEAHKLVLYACSPFFKQLIEEDLGQKHLVFFFSDVKYEIMKAIIDYMYLGEVHIQNDYLKDFIRVAEKLKIRGLVKDNLAAMAGGSSSTLGDHEMTDSDTEQTGGRIDKRVRMDDSLPGGMRRAANSNVVVQEDVRIDPAAAEATTNALCSLLSGKTAGEQLQGIEVGK